MDNFEDLQEVAAQGSDKNSFWPTFTRRMVKFYAIWFLIFPFFGPAIIGVSGWGIAGGVAGLLMSLTLVFFYTEIHFLIKGE